MCVCIVVVVVVVVVVGAIQCERLEEGSLEAHLRLTMSGGVCVSTTNVRDWKKVRKKRIFVSQ